MTHSGGHLLDLGGSWIQKGGQTLRASIRFVGHRCMNVLVWARSALLKQVRSLSLLPADVRTLLRGLRVSLVGFLFGHR